MRSTQRHSRSTKIFTRATAVSAVLAAGLTLSACGNDDDSSDKSSSSSATTAAESSKESDDQTPTAKELSDVLNRAVDPNIPTAEKVDTVVNGDQAPELFDALTKSRTESGATLDVVDPVLPSLTPGNVNATVNLTVPNQEPHVVSDVEFVNEEGKWKLDQGWACTLVENVLPDQVPPMCKDL
ncbi:putative secreted protein [Corynebacterium jeikeium K411]|uniref:Putative secreted protein n=1 Tax=Corynebacterium jeikeium (strain K411) TaxID=306537 RepID=Q4JW82_CORJK|nr:hypothetical protein [Corynebacterium jeikeium]CAI36925.1 putative secreted protein [Corynebacterium jeikeium K411]